jgi:hypothetical protein
LEKILNAVTKAVLAKPELLTGDFINAITGGHGMLNLAGFCAANAIAEEILKGKSLKIEALNQPEIEMDTVIEAGVHAAKQLGADPSNAALITAALCYIAGSNVRAGVPSGNRKLGAMARIKAGAQKGAISILPTPKSNNKISGFPAVHEIYHQMMEGKLTRIDGRDIPPGVTGTPLCGHSALGEDYIFPEIAENAARIGTLAMIKAYAGAGLRPNPFISAIFGTAAALEIVHPDSPAPEKFGPSFHVFNYQLAGQTAAKAAGMPEEIHFRVTGEKFVTGKLIGDLGMILKDMGTPTVVGMIAFYEIFGCFAESGKIGTGGSGGPKTAPIGHVLADAALALRTIVLSGSIERAAEVISKNKEGFIDPELASVEANTVARKVEELRKGPVSRAVLLATEKRTLGAIESRIRKTFDALSQGGKLGEVVQSFARERINTVERRGSEMMSRNFGKSIEIKILKLEGGARRSGNLAKKIWVLDPDVDLTVKIDGEEFLMNSFTKDIIPQAILQKDTRKLEAISMVAPLVGELLISGHTLIDLEVPAAVAALLGKQSPEEAAKEAGYFGRVISGGLPGCEQKIGQVAQLALDFYKKT